MKLCPRSEYKGLSKCWMNGWWNETSSLHTPRETEERNRSSHPIWGHMARHTGYLTMTGDQEARYGWRQNVRPLGTSLFNPASYHRSRSEQSRAHPLPFEMEGSSWHNSHIPGRLKKQPKILYWPKVKWQARPREYLPAVGALQPTISVGREWAVLDCDFLLFRVMGWVSCLPLLLSTVSPVWTPDTWGLRVNVTFYIPPSSVSVIT